MQGQQNDEASRQTLSGNIEPTVQMISDITHKLAQREAEASPEPRAEPPAPAYGYGYRGELHEPSGDLIAAYDDLYPSEQQRRRR